MTMALLEEEKNLRSYLLVRLYLKKARSNIPPPTESLAQINILNKLDAIDLIIEEQTEDLLEQIDTGRLAMDLLEETFYGRTPV